MESSSNDVLASLPESLGLAALHLDFPRLQFHATAAGPESGELVVLLHGFPENWYSWRHQIPALSQAGFFVVAPDQRGYGLSGKAPPYDTTTLARDVVDLVHALGRERAHLVGHDWGAAVAWIVATDYPDVVDRLAILNVPHPAELMRALLGGDRRQLLKSWYAFFFQLPSLPERLLSAAGYRVMRRAMLGSAKPGTFSERDLAVYLSAWSQPGALRAMLGWYRAAFRPGSLRGRAYQRIDAPGLILWGERDVALRVELAEASLRWLARGRLVRYPEATHWVHEDLPSEVNRELVAHLVGSRERPLGLSPS